MKILFYFPRISRKKEKGKEENIKRRKIYFCGGDKTRRRKRKIIFGEGNYIFAKEKEREENIWRRKLYFLKRRRKT